MKLSLVSEIITCIDYPCIALYIEGAYNNCTRFFFENKLRNSLPVQWLIQGMQVATQDFMAIKDDIKDAAIKLSGA